MKVPNNFVYAWNYPWRRLLDKILYEVEKSDIPRQLLRPVLFSLLQVDIVIDFFTVVGIVPLK